MNMKKNIILIFLFLLPFINVEASENKPYEMPRTQIISIKNSETGGQNTLYIKLPKGYEENNDTQYSVIYFTDPVQHIEILSAVTEVMMENVILVGISWQKGMTLKFEHVDSYLNFLRKDVIKTIEKNYRTDPDNCTYFGYSAGALVGAYILSTQTDTFKNYILGSPAFTNGPEVKQKVFELESNAAKQRKNLNANVFISYGTLEKEEDIKHFEEFITMLKNKSDKSLSLKQVVVEGDHSTAFPMTAVRSVQWLSQMNNFPVHGDPYFGQKPPGLTPEVFAPGIVSINGRYEHGISFSPDLDEIYFSANKKGEETSIYFTKLKGEKWTPIKKANFTKGKKESEEHPFVSLSDEKIYFEAGVKLWYVNRLEDSWSDAIQLDSPINDDRLFYPNQAKNGDLFYTDISDFQNIKIKYAPNKNGNFPEVKEVEIEFGVHGFISPSQDFLLVNARNKEGDERKDNDIYVYFKEKDGTWTKPINLGNSVNSNFDETVPSITPDGKYLFFSRYNEEGGLSNFYWVSTEVIENLRPKQ